MIDAEGLDSLIADLTDAPIRARLRVTAIVARGADNVKRDAARLISGLAHAPHYPASISYDLRWSGDTFEAEIGPDKTRPQGALGNILEYGTANNPPHTHLGPALDLEGPRFEQAIADASERAL